MRNKRYGYEIGTKAGLWMAKVFGKKVVLSSGTVGDPRPLIGHRFRGSIYIQGTEYR